MEDNEMLKLADKLKKLREEKSSHEESVKLLNAEINHVEMDLVDYMVNTETFNFDHAGSLFSVRNNVYASIYSDQKEECFDVLREHGAGSLIKETVNSNTLSSYVKELMEENDGEIPSYLEPYINVFNKQTISIRKSTKK